MEYRDSWLIMGKLKEQNDKGLKTIANIMSSN